MSIEYALFVRTTNAWEFALCALMFAFIFPRKKKFLMRLGLGCHCATSNDLQRFLDAFAHHRTGLYRHSAMDRHVLEHFSG